MEIYRGDTFKLDFTANLDGETYPFKAGDTLKVAIKDKLTNTKYIIMQEIKIDKETETVPIIFPHNETKQWSLGEKMLEVELTDENGTVTTLYQGKIQVKGDVIDE